MDSPRKTARIAGALYLVSAIAADGPLIYVSGTLTVAGNAAATAGNILASETLFRASMVSELAGAVIFIFMVRALYRLLVGVDKAQASLMVTLVLISVPITFLNVLMEVAALALLPGVRPQRQALALLCLDLHAEGAGRANTFWGLRLFPFGALVIRSGFLPRWLGAWLLANGAALVAVSLIGLLLLAYADRMSRAAILTELGELVMMIWLLVRGVNVPATVAPVSP
jgi:hypothetical protein